MRLILTFSFIFLIGCGKSSGGDDSSSAKGLFSVWTDHSNGHVLDLTQGYFGTSTMYFLFPTGGKCQCVLTMSGTDSSGNYTLASCGYMAGTGTGDPGCAAVDQTGGFSNVNSSLQVCPTAQSCEYYN